MINILRSRRVNEHWGRNKIEKFIRYALRPIFSRCKWNVAMPAVSQIRWHIIKFARRVKKNWMHESLRRYRIVWKAPWIASNEIGFSDFCCARTRACSVFAWCHRKPEIIYSSACDAFACLDQHNSSRFCAVFATMTTTAHVIKISGGCGSVSPAVNSVNLFSRFGKCLRGREFA